MKHSHSNPHICAALIAAFATALALAPATPMPPPRRP